MNFKQFPIRELDNGFVEILKNRIKNEGYNKSKPLSVVKKDGVLLIFDGNHRYEACKQLGIKDIPYVEYPESTELVGAGIKANRDEETSKPMTFLDYAFLTKKLHKEGNTYDDIGKVLGWSKTKISFYIDIAEKLDEKTLNKVKEQLFTQIPKNVNLDDLDSVNIMFTSVNLFNPSSFRDITSLNPENQLYIVEEIIKKKGELKGRKLKDLCKKRKLFEEMEGHVNENLLNTDAKEELLKDINNGVYDDIKQVENKVTQLNKEAQKQLIHGDAIEELKKLDDNYIDVVITDPPYGQNYVSNRRGIDYEELNKPIMGDKKEEMVKVLRDVINILDKKTKAECHLYMFSSWKNLPIFMEMIKTKFEIKNVLFWDKKDHGAGDLDYWAEQVELIIFAMKGRKPLLGENRPTNLIRFGKVMGKREHPTQKPVDLLKFLIEKSATEGDVVCDPFMGVGSTIVACGDRNPYIGIEIEEKYYKIAKRRVESE